MFDPALYPFGSVFDSYEINTDPLCFYKNHNSKFNGLAKYTVSIRLYMML